MIKNIVLDFGAVLVQYDFEGFFDDFFGSKDESERFLRQVLTPENNNNIDKGDRPVAFYKASWKRQWPQYARAIDAMDEHYADIFTGEVPGMAELMAELKGRGYRLLGLSNWSAKVHEVMAKFPRIFGLLDGWLISYQVKELKPHPEIYLAFCRKFGVRAEECVFIDDRSDNAEGARVIGMQGIVFHDAAQLRRELEAMHILGTQSADFQP